MWGEEREWGDLKFEKQRKKAQEERIWYSKGAFGDIASKGRGRSSFFSTAPAVSCFAKAKPHSQIIILPHRGLFPV